MKSDPLPNVTEQFWDGLDQLARARDDAMFEAGVLAGMAKCVAALPALKGQPKTYNWAQQNLNSGHDQACHKALKAIRAIDPASVKL